MANLWLADTQFRHNAHYLHKWYTFPTRLRSCRVRGGLHATVILGIRSAVVAGLLAVDVMKPLYIKLSAPIDLL